MWLAGGRDSYAWGSLQPAGPFAPPFGRRSAVMPPSKYSKPFENPGPVKYVGVYCDIAVVILPLFFFCLLVFLSPRPHFENKYFFGVQALAKTSVLPVRFSFQALAKTSVLPVRFRVCLLLARASVCFVFRALARRGVLRPSHSLKHVLR